MLSELLAIDRPLISVDLETTGRNPERARIVQMGLVIMRPGQPAKEWKSLVNPGQSIPAHATAVHHITDEMVKDAPRFTDLAKNIHHGFQGADFCGTNVRYDLRVLVAELARAGIEWAPIGSRILDSYRNWQILEPRSLEDALGKWLPECAAKTCGHPECSMDGAHDALWDARNSARIIEQQVLASGGKLPASVQGLHDLANTGFLDWEGKIRLIDGEYRFSFGKHKDDTLLAVPKSYFMFILKGQFSADLKEICRGMLAGKYPVPPPEAQPAEPDDATENATE